MKEKFEKEQKDNHNHIEDLMTDMPDMEDDEKFRQWLEETYINEAELMEKSLLAGQEYEKNLDTAEELSVPREKFYQRLKEEGLYEEADEAAIADGSVSKMTGEKIISMEARTSKEADTAARATEGSNSSVKTGVPENGAVSVTEESRPVRKKRSYLRLGKVAGVAGVCLLCVFAASMTSEANRKHFIDGIRYLTGDDTRVILGNDVENENINVDEYKAIENIESKIGVKIPEFYYRPDGMEFLDYSVSEKALVAQMEYQCEDTIIMFRIDKQNQYTSSNIFSLHGEEQDKIIAGDEETEVIIDKVYDSDEETPSYTASWMKDDTVYTLSGRINIDELEKIIKFMKF